MAWNAWADGVRGRVLVAADAMRKEVYPVLFDIDDKGVVRLTADTVVKAADAPAWVAEALRTLGEGDVQVVDAILGDALVKYAGVFEPLASLADESLWAASGRGLLLADRMGGDPATLLPVYTRLSDAEENERIRLAKEDGNKNLRTGVQLFEGSQDVRPLSYRPLDAARCGGCGRADPSPWKRRLEPLLSQMSCCRKDRTWWAAFDGATWAIAADGSWLAVNSQDNYRFDISSSGIAAGFFHGRFDARNLGAAEMTLEVRASNVGAQTFTNAWGCNIDASSYLATGKMRLS
ncbi:MAG: hypothetical protein ACLTQI_04790 [Slackia sp.]